MTLRVHQNYLLASSLLSQIQALPQHVLLLAAPSYYTALKLHAGPRLTLHHDVVDESLSKMLRSPSILAIMLREKGVERGSKEFGFDQERMMGGKCQQLVV